MGCRIKPYAWLPENVAEAFYALALRQDQTQPYGSFRPVPFWLKAVSFFFPALPDEYETLSVNNWKWLD